MYKTPVWGCAQLVMTRDPPSFVACLITYGTWAYLPDAMRLACDVGIRPFLRHAKLSEWILESVTSRNIH